MSLIPELGKQKQMDLFEFYPVSHGEFQTSHGCVAILCHRRKEEEKEEEEEEEKRINIHE